MTDKLTDEPTGPPPPPPRIPGIGLPEVGASRPPGWKPWHRRVWDWLTRKA